MYSEKMDLILNDLENKEIELAGGSVVGIVLSTVNSLIKYISNLTTGKKKYEDCQEKVTEILKRADKLKVETLQIIDEDKEILEEILKEYKSRKENYEKYQQVCKKSVEFCMQVLEKAYDTLKLSEEISKVGNKMLASDFKICKYYSFASIEAAIANVDINLNSIEDEQYKKIVKEKYKKILDNAKEIAKYK